MNKLYLTLITKENLKENIKGYIYYIPFYVYDSVIYNKILMRKKSSIYVKFNKVIILNEEDFLKLKENEYKTTNSYIIGLPYFKYLLSHELLDLYHEYGEHITLDEKYKLMYLNRSSIRPNFQCPHLNRGPHPLSFLNHCYFPLVCSFFLFLFFFFYSFFYFLFYAFDFFTKFEQIKSFIIL